MNPKPIGEMTAAEQVAAAGAHARQSVRAPESWKEWTQLDENGEEWGFYDIDGWILAAVKDDGLDIDGSGETPTTHHFLISSVYLPGYSPGSWNFVKTALGGVRVPIPPSVRGTHIRQIHVMDSRCLPEAWRVISEAAGTPLQVRIKGSFVRQPRHEDICTEVYEAGKFKGFHVPDFKCPTVCVDDAEIAGEPKLGGARDVVHIKIPFTRWHVGVSMFCWAYRRPADPQAIQGIQRGAQQVKPSV